MQAAPDSQQPSKSKLLICGGVNVGFKIVDSKNRKEYPDFYEDGKPEFYIRHVKIMERRHDISLSKIKEVVIGDSEYPFTEIHFQDGLTLYDEQVSPFWTQDENKKRISERGIY